MDKQLIDLPVTLFYSYAREDEMFCDELEKHLSLLQRQGIIMTWYDRLIRPGTPWTQSIDYHLNVASVVLLLVSPDFLASDYCFQVEMQRALERHKLGEATVIPVILRPVDWQGAPFAYLQCLPHDGKPVTEWENRDAAFRDIVRGIRTTIEKRHGSGSIKLLPVRPDQIDLKVRAVTNTDKSISVTYELGDAKFLTSRIVSRDVQQILPLMARDFPRVHYRFGEEATLQIQEIARRVSTFLLPPQISKQLHEKRIRKAQILINQTDPPLPWELLHDGEEFLGLQIPIVNTPLERATEQGDFHPKSLLIVESLPTEFGFHFNNFRDRYMRYIENIEGMTSVSRVQVVDIRQLATIVSCQDFDIIQIATHSFVDPKDDLSSSLLRFSLGEGSISVEEFCQIFSTEEKPRLIILDACESALSFPYHQPSFRTNAAYLLSRSGLYVIGPTSWLAMPESEAFGRAFYTHLMKHQNIGEAVRSAKQHLADLGQAWWVFSLFGPGS